MTKVELKAELKAMTTLSQEVFSEMNKAELLRVYEFTKNLIKAKRI